MIKSILTLLLFPIALLAQSTATIHLQGAGGTSRNVIKETGEEETKVVVRLTPPESRGIRVYFSVSTTNADRGEKWRGGNLAHVQRDSIGEYIVVQTDRAFLVKAIDDLLPGVGEITFQLEANSAYLVGSEDSVTILTEDNDVNVPNAPSGLVLTSPANSQVSIAWTDNSDDEEHFAIERSSDAGSTWVRLAEDDASPYLDTGLGYGTYHYRVSAENAGGRSAWITDSISLTIDPPDTPTGLTATATGPNTVDLAWNDVASETQYVIVRNAIDLATVAADVIAYTDTGAAANTAYTYQVRAENDGGASLNSLGAAVTTHPDSIAAPTGISFDQVTLTSFRVNWTDNSSIEEEFRLELATNAQFSGAATAAAAADATTYTFSGLAPGTTYYVRVSAYTTTPSTLQSLWLSGSQATPPAIPPTPMNLAVSLTGSDSLLVSWSSSTGATSYRVEQSINGGAWSIVASPTATQLARTGLSASTTYAYRVYAINGSGVSAATASVSVTTPDPPPPPPPSNIFFVRDTDPIPWSSINLARDTADVTVYFDQDGSLGSTFVLDLTNLDSGDTRPVTFDGNSQRYNGSSWAESGASTTRGGNQIQRVRMQNASHTKYSNVKIRGFTIRCNTAAKAVSLAGDDLVLEYCDIAHTAAATDGALIELIPTANAANGGTDSYSAACDNVVIRECDIGPSYGEAIYLGGGGSGSSQGYPSHTRVMVENCSITQAGLYGGQGDAIDIKGGLSGVVIRGNTIELSNVSTRPAGAPSGWRAIVSQGHANSSAVYWDEYPGIKLVIEGNIIRDCNLDTRGAIDLNGGSWAQPTGATRVINNLVHDITGSPAYGIVHEESHSGELLIANNTIARAAGAGIRLASGAAGSAEVINNALWSNNSGGNQVSFGSTPPTYANTGYSGSLSPSGDDPLLLASDPFTSAAGDDFTLPGGSPLIDAGLDDSRIVVDLTQSDRIGTIDIGAYEGESSDEPPPPPPPPPVAGITHYVTTTASGGGNGSQSAPWTAYEAFTQAPAGAVVGFTDGTYNCRLLGPLHIQRFEITASGTPSNPIVFRSINRWGASLVSPGGAIRTDQPARAADSVIIINSGTHDVWLQNFDIYNSNTTRVHTDPTANISNPAYTIMPVGAGINNFGDRIKIIGCKIHDVTTPIAHWGNLTRGESCEFAGNVIYNWGCDAPLAPIGHGFYFQNGLGTCKLINNLVIDGADLGGQIFGSSAAVLRDIEVRGNTFKDEVIIGPKGSPAINITYAENVMFGHQVRFGFEWGRTSNETPHSSGWTITDNWFVQALNEVEDHAFLVRFMPDDASFTMSRNNIVRYTGVYDVMVSSYAAAGYAWPYSNWTVQGNRFWGDGRWEFLSNSGGNLSVIPGFSLADWNRNYNANDTFTSSFPTGATSFVRPNPYEPGVAMVTILNWDQASSVTVDLSSVFGAGDSWRVYDTYNMGRGVWQSGSGTSGSFQFSGRTRENPIGNPLATALHWAFPAVNPRFGAFVVVKQ